MPSSNYEPIANEYYDDYHITSRNFDAATFDFCSKFDFKIPPKGLILELGSGRGCVGKYWKITSSRVIQVDISETMLSVNPREECLLKMRCNALKLPFTSSQFCAVTAFLYDPYNRIKLYYEVYRMLSKGGLFIGTLPHYTWGITLRKILRYSRKKTKFLTKDKRLIELDSLLMTDTEIQQVITQAGLTLIKTYDLCLPPQVKNVSEHIMIPATSLGLTVYTLPIVKLIMARK